MHIRRKLGAVLALSASLGLGGCYALYPSAGGGQTTFKGARAVIPSDVAVPAGYRIEAVAKTLNLPSAVAFDDDNRAYILEAGYSYGEVFTKPRLLRLEADGTLKEIATGDNAPWNGVSFHDGSFYIVQGGEQHGGAILRIWPDGQVTKLVDDLPSVGDHHTNGPVVRGGYVYFAVGTATNSAIVGPDNYEFGWLKRYPKFCDIPARDIRLIGVNYTSTSPLPDGKNQKVSTGAFLPYGAASVPGQVIKGQVPCSGAIMRVPIGGGKVELIAWGFRNPFGLAFSPSGQLYTTDNMYDSRGLRPIWGAGDVLWRVDPGSWYGWPDYHAGTLVTEGKRYKAPGENPPKALIADPPGRVPEPAAILAVHGSASGLDFSRSSAFGHVGEAFVAQFGDMAPGTGKVMRPVGFSVVRVDVDSGVIEEFAVNKGVCNGPASRARSGGLERPVAVRFDNTGDALYVVDFGVMTVTGDGPKPWQNTGVVWRITREGK